MTTYWTMHYLHKRQRCKRRHIKSFHNSDICTAPEQIYPTVKSDETSSDQAPEQVHIMIFCRIATCQNCPDSSPVILVERQMSEDGWDGLHRARPVTNHEREASRGPRLPVHPIGGPIFWIPLEHHRKRNICGCPSSVEAR
ncbi:hypothetical protein KEM48_002329 [Puccinia striiformis f. sp. tritici PST-130]|nr:hypothetical protein Pst134EB_016476 [Puccinia striiformis f. sp. tritici]KAI9604698.1 hypothetical protein KEM48_002329 [Puccinia striiformis f. sp. tritici PST-130]